MPIVKINNTPAAPEGEYAGKIEKVASGFTKVGDPKFSFIIRTKDGLSIKDNLYFGEKVKWRIPNLCKSANLVIPDNGNPFALTPDDLEDRTVWFSVKYNPGEEGKVFTNINYHTMVYAIQQNPALAGAYPVQAPRKLREMPPEDPPPGPDPSSGTPPSSPQINPPAGTNGGVGVAEAEDDDLTPEEYAAALAQAKRNKAGKAAA
jgi:hypothetical protein